MQEEDEINNRHCSRDVPDKLRACAVKVMD